MNDPNLTTVNRVEIIALNQAESEPVVIVNDQSFCWSGTLSVDLKLEICHNF